MAEDYVIRCGEFTLTDGDPLGVGVCEKLTFGGKHLLEVVGRINADAPTIFDRARKDKEISISIFRQHASYADALNFAARHDEALPGVATLEIEITEDAETTILRSEGCGWEAVTQEPIGVSTLTEYRVIRGGRFAVETEAELELVIGAGTSFLTEGDVIDAGAYE